jgi:hypothetical protein
MADSRAHGSLSMSTILFGSIVVVVGRADDWCALLGESFDNSFASLIAGWAV